jgi:glycosyltransferase involved in cell wall biosynthesis
MPIELSIVMPCLNEAETLATCITSAQTFLTNNAINGEVIVSDNGSTDGSQDIVKQLGATLVHAKIKGYGSALRTGIENAQGTYVILADSDGSHDIEHLLPFLKALRAGTPLVVGNRFKGNLTKQSMPFLHRYFGNPVLTKIANLFFKSNIGDFHCGLRGFRKDVYNRLSFTTTGMDFASELIVKFTINGYKAVEVPTNVFPSGRSRKPHLKTWPDGWRHLRFLLLYSPKWLFLLPGIVFILLGLILNLLTLDAFFTFNDLSKIKLTVSSVFFVLSGFQLLLFFSLSKIYGMNNGLLPKSKNYDEIFKIFTLEKGLLIGTFVFLISSVMLLWHFLSIDSTNEIQKLVNYCGLTFIGLQIIVFSFFYSMLGLKKDM